MPGRHETTTSYKNEIPAESLYRTSIENWVLPPPQYHQGNDFSDDEEWLFKTQRENRYECERYEARNDAIGCRSPMLRPRAYFLPEADVYALPYTVPFWFFIPFFFFVVLFCLGIRGLYIRVEALQEILIIWLDSSNFFQIPPKPIVNFLQIAQDGSRQPQGFQFYFFFFFHSFFFFYIVKHFFLKSQH